MGNQKIRINEVGNRYGRLQVIKYAGNIKSGHAAWECLCDCGKIVVVNGRNLRTGNTCSCGCLRNTIISKGRLKNKNPNWKGNDVGYGGLHDWIRDNKPKPEFCEICKKRKPIDLANISQKYHRDINDFEWLCRRCHMEKDGRLIKLKKRMRDKFKHGPGTH